MQSSPRLASSNEPEPARVCGPIVTRTTDEERTPGFHQGPEASHQPLSQAKQACATDSRHLPTNRHRLFRRPVTNPSLNTSAWVSWREVDLLQESRCYRRYAILRAW